MATRFTNHTAAFYTPPPRRTAWQRETRDAPLTRDADPRRGTIRLALACVALGCAAITAAAALPEPQEEAR